MVFRMVKVYPKKVEDKVVKMTNKTTKSHI